MISFLNHHEDISSHGATYDNAGILLSIENSQVLTMCAHSKFLLVGLFHKISSFIIFHSKLIKTKITVCIFAGNNDS